MANKYCTLEQIKPYLSIESDEDDQLLNDIIERATRIIEVGTGRIFFCDTPTTEYYDYEHYRNHRGEIYLDKDLAEIVSITNGDSTIVGTDKYVTNPNNFSPIESIKLKRNSSIYWTYTDTPENAIAINGYWAYSKTPPLDIVHACIRLTSFLYRQKDNAVDQDRAMGVGDGMMIFPVNIPKDVSNVLKFYQRIV